MMFLYCLSLIFSLHYLLNYISRLSILMNFRWTDRIFCVRYFPVKEPSKSQYFVSFGLEPGVL